VVDGPAFGCAAEAEEGPSSAILRAAWLGLGASAGIGVSACAKGGGLIGPIAAGAAAALPFLLSGVTGVAQTTTA
jgi:hypothetical protein